MIFFEPKRRYWDKGDVDGTDPSMPSRSTKPASPALGTDVTVAAYGPMVATSIEAAGIGAEEGISVEVVDLRSLSPIDFETLESLSAQDRTAGRRPRGTRVRGLGAEIAAQVTEQCFYSLESPVRRVGGFATPYPAAKLERHFLPDADRILHEVDRCLRP